MNSDIKKNYNSVKYHKMRNSLYKILGAFLVGTVIFACKKSFLERVPEASFNEAALANKFGVNATLIAAYAALDGWSDNGWNNAAGNPWPAAGSNWIFGSQTTDDAYTGSQPNDQVQAEIIRRYDWQPGLSYFRAKFQTIYWGVGTTNITLRLLDKVTDMTQAEKDQIIGEAKFLRAHYHFEGYKMWKNIPYIDETVTNYRLKNDVDIFPQIVADFQDAIAKLPEKTSNASGRATKGAAQAYLARAYMYNGSYNDALPLLNAVITANKYSLVDNFMIILTLPSKTTMSSCLLSRHLLMMELARVQMVIGAIVLTSLMDLQLLHAAASISLLKT
ncbi:MAG: hypothetical protein HC867_08290 [Bacteroidia bacterium]|nr:hypothetical protein [Bacteroidia bacterium]